MFVRSRALELRSLHAAGEGPILGERGQHIVAYLAPTLDATQQAWTHVASRWGEMTTPASRTDLDLVHAAEELRAAVREVAPDKTTWARPEVMAARVDLGEAGHQLQQAMSTAVDVAYVTRDVAAHDADLTGPARAMSHRANAETDCAPDRDHRDEGVAWVTPGDVYANRTVAIPEPVRAGLVDATDTLVQTACNAMSAAACLDRATQGRPTGSEQEPPAPPLSRRHEGATPVAKTVPRIPVP